MKSPPCNAVRSRVDGHHVFPRGTTEPKDYSDVRKCIYCGAEQVAAMPPPRAKKLIKWYWSRRIKGQEDK